MTTSRLAAPLQPGPLHRHVDPERRRLAREAATRSSAGSAPDTSSSTAVTG